MILIDENEFGTKNNQDIAAELCVFVIWMNGVFPLSQVSICSRNRKFGVNSFECCCCYCCCCHSSECFDTIFRFSILSDVFVCFYHKIQLKLMVVRLLITGRVCAFDRVISFFIAWLIHERTGDASFWMSDNNYSPGFMWIQSKTHIMNDISSNRCNCVCANVWQKNNCNNVNIQRFHFISFKFLVKTKISDFFYFFSTDCFFLAD